MYHGKNVTPFRRDECADTMNCTVRITSERWGAGPQDDTVCGKPATHCATELTQGHVDLLCAEHEAMRISLREAYEKGQAELANRKPTDPTTYAVAAWLTDRQSVLDEIARNVDAILNGRSTGSFGVQLVDTSRL